MKHYLLLLLLLPTLAIAIDPRDTRMLSQPAISGNHIAFIYADDLWIANPDGSQPRRLTVHEGAESSPVFSPDGSMIAFSAQYDGNTDVFIVPAAGGVPVRLTWHPRPDFVRGFTPDGKNVLFASQRNSFSGRYLQLFTVPVTGGYPTQLEIPNGYFASYSSDGKYLAYTPLQDGFRQWKNYRGGMIATISIFSFQDKSVVKIPQPAGGCNDTGPQWMNDKVYFRSDRNGEFNLFSYDVASKEVKQLTTFADFPVLNMSASAGKIVLEQAGYLYLFDQSAKKLTVGIASDLLELRPRFVKGADYVRSSTISPGGSRAAFDFRGDIVTVPAEKGDARNLTMTTGVHEKFPSWSPDGKSIAYFSDASGEYQLHIKSQDGKGVARIIPVTGTGFYAYPTWSPDSKTITFVDNGRNFYLLDVVSGVIKKIDNDELYFPGAFRNMFGDWSPDSRWIAYTKITDTYFRKVFIYSVDQGRSFPVTDGLSDASEAVFDRTGKYMFLLASTDAGPVVNWFDQSTADMESTSSIYLLTLRKETISPFAKESDEEKSAPVAKEEAADKKDSGKKNTDVPKTEPMRIDWDGIQNRIIAVPVEAGNFAQLRSPKEDVILYVVSDKEGNHGKMHQYDIKKRKDFEVMELDSYQLSADGKKMLYRKEQTWGISAGGEKPEDGKGVLATGDLEVKIDPTAEWPAMFNEAWRVNRDYFYDPGMHGADWPAIRRKYAVFLPDLVTRGDLNRVLQWMFSELSVGHHFILDGGTEFRKSKHVDGGLLGADYTIDHNRYRIKKIYGGLNWNPDLRSPLTEPGVNASVGDYIIAVNGMDVTADRNIDQFFENTSGKIVELTLSAAPATTGTRVVNVVPVGDEYTLRNRDWVEGNLKKVNEATNGQVAYVYVPNTAELGHDYFKRYFFPQADKKAIIIDERFNGGGLLADYYIDILQRPYQANWNMRYGKDLKSPSASIQGPKVMITDETAGSGGDMLPWMFHKFKVGTIVGKRTWGGLVGILGFPEFIDGGEVTAPNVGIWTKDGFIVENVGVSPDIEVEQTPSEVIKGNDPQLQKAIEVALKQLTENPPVTPVRPAYPVRVRK